MSGYANECYAVYTETVRRARKQHACSACREPIPVGHRYAHISAIFQGEVSVYRRCARCQALHRHLRTLGSMDEWPDERLSCGQDYLEHWGTEPPEEIAALAFLPANEAQGLLP